VIANYGKMGWLVKRDFRLKIPYAAEGLLGQPEHTHGLCDIGKVTPIRPIVEQIVEQLWNRNTAEQTGKSRNRLELRDSERQRRNIVWFGS
jgi:hypothetical protein